MSYSASTIGFPVLRDSRSASSAVFCRIFSASLNNTRPRSCAVVFDHDPSSNAFRAAFTATSTSALSAALTRAITSSVDGSYTGKVWPVALLVHCPFTKFRYVFTSAFTPPDMPSSKVQPPRAASPQISTRRNRFCQLSRRLPPSIHKKEKCRKPHKQQRAAKHPHLIRQERSNLRSREKRQSDSQRRGHQPASARKDQHSAVVVSFLERWIRGNFQQGAKHVKKRHQLQHHRQGQ